MRLHGGMQLLQGARPSQAVQAAGRQRRQLNTRRRMGVEAAAEAGGLATPARDVADAQQLQGSALVHQLPRDGVLYPLRQRHD